MSVSRQSSADEKIVLFQSLFRGRDDVYPRRFESQRTGKSGYQPACSNEWVPGICEKPRIKCATCRHRRFLPVTDAVIRQHLSGCDDQGREFVMGVYPMLLDETCFFLAIDFDKQAWIDDARAVLETCRQLDLPAALERSRSGACGHLWLLFDEAIPATLVRRLGSHLLTETMERRPEIGLDSYDRFFPNQDTLPQGGFGNLIALPLQKQPRASGNSVFIDEDLRPYTDQWAYLSSIRKLERSTVEEIVSRAERRGRVVGVRLPVSDDYETEPWMLPPSRRRQEPAPLERLSGRVELTLGDQIYLAKDRLSAGLPNDLIRLAAFQNPEFYKAQAMRLPTYDKPRIIGCAEDYSHHIGLPRGCLEEVQRLLTDHRIDSVIQDKRFSGRQIEASFHGELTSEQLEAARAMLRYDSGVLSAPTAFGKTVIAAWLIAQRNVNTLIIVHRRQLLEQWMERMSGFLELPPKSIGRIGGGRRKPTGVIDVAVIQSLVRKGTVDDCVGKYGFLIVDECHHVSAKSFEDVLRRAKARFVAGLSATVTRKDGHHPIVMMQCGPIRHRVDPKSQAAVRPIEHEVRVRPTPFQTHAPADPDARIQFHDLYQELIASTDRNRLICSDVQRAVRDGRSPLVLTERNEHLDLRTAELSSRVRHVVVFRGGQRAKQVRAAADRLAAIPSDEERVMVATGRYVGEGFDDARLDTLFLTLPVSWRGTIPQYVGRLHRSNHGKRLVQVYDYADLNVPMLARMFDRRCRGYEAVGYKLLLPGSAVPGWPADVPLPVDPVWKNEHASTVRRLVRDGIDAPLARLFVHATQTPACDADGEARARSATEAFVFRRLKSLSTTAGRFRLNVELPIPFDGMGKMEVDLLCAEAKIVIEIDGEQHLHSAEAYRRDRRKDRLLQENGYLVLRFLAEDVGTQLDMMLDAIHEALANRCR